ncbi:MAG: hypothetical protein ACERKO_05415 [Acetanaerobacterium sp.]
MLKTFYAQIDEVNRIRDIISYPYEDYVPVEVNTPLPAGILGGAYELRDGQIIYNKEWDVNVDIETLKAQIATVIPAEPETLEGHKKSKVALSKKMLAVYLEENPLLSTAHGGVSKLYSVTAEKQSLITGILLMANAAAQTGVPYEVTWNATGESCEAWTAAELSQLAFEINAYIKPLIAEQQHVEVVVAACQSIEDVQSVVIDYANCPQTSV